MAMLLFLRLAPLTSGLIGEDAEGSPETSPIAQDLHLTLAEGDWWRTSFVSESWSSPLQLSVKVLSSTGCSEGATTDGTCVFGLKLYGSQHGPSASTVRCHAAGRRPPACSGLLPYASRLAPSPRRRGAATLRLALGRPAQSRRSHSLAPTTQAHAREPRAERRGLAPLGRGLPTLTRARARARTLSPTLTLTPYPGPGPGPDPDPDPSPSPSPNQARSIVCSCPLARSSG